MYQKVFKKIIILFSFLVLIFNYVVLAEDLTSTNFIIRDPVIGTGGSYGSSTNFRLYGSGNITFSGDNSSTSFIGRYGFLYFPFIDVGTLTAVQNGVDADLSWTASSAGLGYNVSGYNTGIASVSGGPYIYTDVSNVTSYTYENLEPGEYCFIVETLDAFDNVIGTSNEDCITIEPVLIFDLDTGVSDGENSAPYSVDLGTLTISDVKNSGTTDNINMIILESTTNAPDGVSVSVKNQNGSNGLVSLSSPSDNINSADGTMASSVENYGLCVITSSLSGFTRLSPYNTGTCATNNNTNDIQGLTNTGETIIGSAGVLVDGHAEISVNASISSSTPAKNDYSDTITFIVTPTF